MIDSSLITVVVQGRHEGWQTWKCLTSVRRLLPRAEIIFSSWIGTRKFVPRADRVVLNEDPGAMRLFTAKDGSSVSTNVNRQIVSTREGLRFSTRRYCLKLRSDFCLVGLGFLNAFERAGEAAEARVFRHRIVALSWYTRNPHVEYCSGHALPMHPSDIALFGLTSDLSEYFDVPLMGKPDERIVQVDTGCFCRWMPEQHLFVNFLRDKGFHVSCENAFDDRAVCREETVRYFSNFIFVGFVAFGVRPPLKFFAPPYLHSFRGCVRGGEGGDYPAMMRLACQAKCVDVFLYWFEHLFKIVVLPFGGVRLRPFRHACRRKWRRKLIGLLVYSLCLLIARKQTVGSRNGGCCRMKLRANY